MITCTSTTAVKNKHKIIITEESNRLDRWKNHYEEINQEPPENPMVTAKDLKRVIKSIIIETISILEVRIGITSLKDSMAGGIAVDGRFRSALQKVAQDH